MAAFAEPAAYKIPIAPSALFIESFTWRVDIWGPRRAQREGLELEVRETDFFLLRSHWRT